LALNSFLWLWIPAFAGMTAEIAEGLPHLTSQMLRPRAKILRLAETCARLHDCPALAALRGNRLFRDRAASCP
jgi:hypothetical protein